MGKPQHLPSVDTTAAPEVNGTGTDQVYPEAYRPDRVDVRLRGAHRETFFHKMRHLMNTGARLQDGTAVTDRSKALLWILENDVKA